MEKWQYCSLLQKKATNKTLKITFQFLYFLPAEKFLKDSFNEMLSFSLVNDLLAPYQSGFKPGTNQLLSITHEIVLDLKLTFEEHLKNAFNKTNKTIGLLRKLSLLVTKTSFSHFLQSIC